ncbi:MICOS complex subunit MIC25 [Galendromus occidentalis]|uniref:MICOS complex subunit MIC25 n=1 Tax=Galendromus occidentalis TaxID=34638 RepID=A0AAJ6QXU8_9ACAR|nr:MICOS complex subunit MIC25 [Galendromus occidentalis]
MGGSQSTRRVTIINETSPDIITISDDVAQRLKNQASAQPMNAASATPSRPAPAAAGYPSYSEMSGRSHQQDMEKLDQEWRGRLDDLANQNKQLYKLATDKFTGSVAEVHQKYVGDRHQAVCQNTQNAVMQCYRKNQKKPLECSREVVAFQNCVSATRLNLSAR